MTADGAPSVTPLDTALEHVREARQFLGERNRYRKALEAIRDLDWGESCARARGLARAALQAEPSQPSQQEEPQ